MEKSSTYESITPVGIVECRGATSSRNRRGEIWNPCRVLTETGCNRYRLLFGFEYRLMLSMFYD